MYSCSRLTLWADYPWMYPEKSTWELPLSGFQIQISCFVLKINTQNMSMTLYGSLETRHSNTTNSAGCGFIYGWKSQQGGFILQWLAHLPYMQRFRRRPSVEVCQVKHLNSSLLHCGYGSSRRSETWPQQKKPINSVSKTPCNSTQHFFHFSCI